MADKVVVAMSGGVDSSVTAALLKQQGYEVTGVTMKIGAALPDNVGERVNRKVRHSCYEQGEEEVEDAKKVAEILNIPFNVFDLRKEYKNEVLDYFYSEYLAGKTPNPCIKCNKMVKFGALVEKIRSSGINFDFIATGHYASTKYDATKRRYLLMKACDLQKDQSYFLFSLSQEQLKHSLFPLGNYTKKEVRNIASDLKLGLEKKKESQDFTANGYSYLFQKKPGDIMDKEGKILGQHNGIQFYTIGQRKGVRLPGKEPLYVISIDKKKNVIVVGKKEELISRELIAGEINWLAIPKLEKHMKVGAKIRYNSKEVEAEISPLGTNKVNVKFIEQVLAVTPGQAVVFYVENTVLGGGIIE